MGEGGESCTGSAWSVAERQVRKGDRNNKSPIVHSPNPHYQFDDYLLGLEIWSLSKLRSAVTLCPRSRLRQRLGDVAGGGSETEGQELRAELRLLVWPPLAPPGFRELPQALLLLRDRPGSSTDVSTKPGCHNLSFICFPLTLLLLQLVSEHLPELPLLPPLLLLLCSLTALLSPVLVGRRPRCEPVQRGDTGDVVVLPGSIFFLCWDVREEPASPGAPCCPQTVLGRDTVKRGGYWMKVHR